MTSGEFELTYHDRRPYDLPGPPGDTPDEVDLSASFTDPGGNEYQLEVDHVVQPPIPGYETGGDVFTNAWHHGLTGTGSPLIPHLYAFGVFWGVGDVIVNGEVATGDGFRIMHFMTTQTARDQDYRLAIDEELPLQPGDTIASQVHHTHGVVLPIRPTADGPVFDPVPTVFELPNGQTQPFIHAMWEQEELVEAPFKGWTPEAGSQASMTDVTVEGDEWTLKPERFTVKKGDPVTVTYRNVGSVAHNLQVGAFDVKTDMIQSGRADTVTFTPDESGEFAYWCGVAGHRDAGMEGTMVVEG